jgi:hypothetical protein
MTNGSTLGLGLRNPVVVLFGAGASRGGIGTNLPPPVDRDFFSIANQLRAYPS